MEQVTAIESRATLTINESNQQVQEAAERETKQAGIAEVRKTCAVRLLASVHP